MQENFIPQSGFITSVDDPEGLGRVKIHCESIDGMNAEQETTWVNILKPSGGFGSDGHSPPQVGTRIIAQVNKTNPSIRQITSVVGSQKQKSNPQMAGNISLASIRESFEKKINEDISGPIKMAQRAVMNGIGSTKSKLEPIIESVKQLSIFDRKELSTQNSANPQMSTEVPPVKNVATARSPEASTFTKTMGDSLPGATFSISGMFDHLKGPLLDLLKEKIPPEVFTAMENMAKTSSSFIPTNVDGFMQDAKRVNPATFATNMVETLKDVKNVKDLYEAMNKIMTDDKIGDLGSLPEIAMEAVGAFGKLPMKMDANGKIKMEASDLIDKAKELFVSLTSGIKSQGGAASFMPGSNIPKEFLDKMLPEKAADFREMFQKLSGDGNAARKMIESRISTVRTKLGG